MKLSFFLVYTLIAISACKPDLDLPDKKRITDYPSLIKEFKDQGKDYRPAPLWVCNNDVSKEDIDFSLNELKDKGMGAYSMGKAKVIGLNIWIYDEYVCPSGFAGGHVFNEMPESSNQGTALTSQKMEKHSILVNDIYEKWL